MSLRIIGGKFRGRRLKSVKSPFISPTSSQLREALFNICQGYTENSYFLDLFAGSGAIGIEAVSRGACQVTFVDIDKRSIHCIKRNIEMLGIQDRCRVVLGDVFEIIKKDLGSYDIIYIDPPYDLYEDTSFIFKLIYNLQENGLIKKGGLIFIEEKFFPHRLDQPYEFEGIVHLSSKRYGDSLLHKYSFL